MCVERKKVEGLRKNGVFGVLAWEFYVADHWKGRGRVGFVLGMPLEWAWGVQWLGMGCAGFGSERGCQRSWLCKAGTGRWRRATVKQRVGRRWSVVLGSYCEERLSAVDGG